MYLRVLTHWRRHREQKVKSYKRLPWLKVWLRETFELAKTLCAYGEEGKSDSLVELSYPPFLKKTQRISSVRQRRRNILTTTAAATNLLLMDLVLNLASALKPRNKEKERLARLLKSIPTKRTSRDNLLPNRRSRRHLRRDLFWLTTNPRRR